MASQGLICYDLDYALTFRKLKCEKNLQDTTVLFTGPDNRGSDLYPGKSSARR